MYVGACVPWREGCDTHPAMDLCIGVPCHCICHRPPPPPPSYHAHTPSPLRPCRADDIIHFGGGHSTKVGDLVDSPATDFVYKFCIGACPCPRQVPP